MGRVTHFEIHASDPERMMRFYADLLGWKFDPWGPPGEYWLITTGAADAPGINGGLFPRRGDRPIDGQPVNAYVCTVEVDSAVATAARAKELGGQEARPVSAIPGMGWHGYAKDPDGNIFGFIQLDAAAK